MMMKNDCQDLTVFFVKKKRKKEGGGEVRFKKNKKLPKKFKKVKSRVKVIG